MSQSSPQELWRDGLWRNNPGTVQLLGLCPLLAVSNSLVNALGLALATLGVLLTSNLCVSSLRGVIPGHARIPVFVLIISGAVTVVELLMRAYAYPVFTAIGLFIPLIVTNCMIIGRAEAFASKASLRNAAVDGLAQGIGFGWVLILLGGLREILGSGTLGAGLNNLLGDWASQGGWQVLPKDAGLLLAILPPGAFLLLGFLLAAKNYIDAHLAARRRPARASVSPGVTT